VTYDDIITLVFAPQPWRKHAACLGLAPELFFPEKSTGQGAAASARLICSTCTVREECLTDALETSDNHGVRGGMTPRERRVEARVRLRASRDAEMAL